VLRIVENWLLFRPVRYTKWWTEPPPELHARDVELLSADGTRLHAWWCPGDGWAPSRGALLFCDGNYGNLSRWGEAVLPLQEIFGALLLIDYPGYGRSAGRPSEAGCYAAAEAAYAWLTDKRQVPAGRLTFFGVSLGGGVVTELATRRDHRALVLVSTYTSIPDVARSLYPWLPARRVMRNRFDNLAKIGRCRRPVFIAHGTADRLIPFSQAERLYAAANEPKRLYPFVGGVHGYNPGRDFYTELARFVEAHAP
jgi:fermentation-respiration switch protein FrsA (DUF1100 family)